MTQGAEGFAPIYTSRQWPRWDINSGLNSQAMRQPAFVLLVILWITNLCPEVIIKMRQSCKLLIHLLWENIICYLGAYFTVAQLDERKTESVGNGLLVCAQSLQSCGTLRDPMDCSLPAPLSMTFPRQEYYNGLPFRPPGDLPDPGVEPESLALQADCLSTEPPGKPFILCLKSGLL